MRRHLLLPSKSFDELRQCHVLRGKTINAYSCQSSSPGYLARRPNETHWYPHCAQCWYSSATFSSPSFPRVEAQRSYLQKWSSNLLYRSIHRNAAICSAEKGSSFKNENTAIRISTSSSSEYERRVRSSERLIHSLPGSLSPGNLEELSSNITYLTKVYRSTTYRSADLPDQLLRRWIEESIEHGTQRTSGIPTGTLNLILQRWRDVAANSSSVSSSSLRKNDRYTIPAAQRAQDLVMYVQELYEQQQQQGCEFHHKSTLMNHPDTLSFSLVIDAWCKTSNDERMFATTGANVDTTGTHVIHANSTAAKADAILKHMHQLHVSGCSTVHPNTICYNTAINAYARWCYVSDTGSARDEAKVKYAAERVQEILCTMQTLHDTGDADVKPDKYTYTSVIDLLSKCDGMAAKAEELLRHMEDLYIKTGDSDIKPNVKSYTAVIHAWNSRNDEDAAENAERILRRMMNMCQHAVSEQVGGDGLDYPDTACFNAFIHVYSKSRKQGSATRAKSILEWMMSLSDRQHEVDYVDRMESSSGSNIMRNVKGITPDRTTFNATINAFAKSSETGSAREAEDILQWMEQLYEGGHVHLKPDHISFTSVIDSLAKSWEDDAALRAEKMLHRMIELSKLGQNDDVRPTTVTFNAVINTWAKSKAPDKADRALSILRQMQELSTSDTRKTMSPNVITYTAVLNACSFTSGDPDVIQRATVIALTVMDELGESATIQPDSVLFSTFIKALTKLLTNIRAREKIALSVFKRCCDAGQVNDSVLSNLAVAAPKVYRTMVGDHKACTDSVNIPFEWTRNVTRRQKRFNYKATRKNS